MGSSYQLVAKKIKRISRPVHFVIVMFGLCVTASSIAQSSYNLPLHEAIRMNDIEFVKAWVSERKPLDQPFNDTRFSLENSSGLIRGLTPLMVAAGLGRLEMSRILVEAGANIYAESRNADGSNPRYAFDYAVNDGYLPVAVYLWEKSDRARFNAKLDVQFHKACLRLCEEKYGSTASDNLALFLAKISDEPTLGNGIALVACTWNALPKLRFLATHGVTFPKNTLHCLASYEGTHYFVTDPKTRMAIAQFLVEHSADPNANAPLGSKMHPPLIGAVFSRDLELVRFLVSQGADPSYENRQGLSPMGAAANTCSYALPTFSSSNVAQMEADAIVRLEIIDYLAKSGASTLVARPMRLLTECCESDSMVAAQKQICARFGLGAR